MAPLPLKSILLVDDDEISNLFNKIFISKLDECLKVHIALNGQEALNLLFDETSSEQTSILTPCLLLLDIKMPHMDGWGFLEVYDDFIPEDIKKDIIIVMVTTSEDEGDLVKAKQNVNIKEIIQKPLSEEKFTILIEKYFGKAHTEKCD